MKNIPPLIISLLTRQLTMHTLTSVVECEWDNQDELVNHWVVMCTNREVIPKNAI